MVSFVINVAYFKHSLQLSNFKESRTASYGERQNKMKQVHYKNQAMKLMARCTLVENPGRVL